MSNNMSVNLEDCSVHVMRDRASSKPGNYGRYVLPEKVREFHRV